MRTINPGILFEDAAERGARRLALREQLANLGATYGTGHWT